MPIYEYLCETCGRRTEQLQNLSDLPLAVCPGCGGALRKLVSAPAFQLKGSGWYQSDYGKKPSGGGDEKGSSKSEGDAEKSSSASSASSASESSSSGSSSSESSATSDSKSAPAKPATKASE